MDLAKPTYRTNDLYFAAFLKTAEFSLIRVDKQGTKKFFVFEDPLNLIKKVQTDYINSVSKVSAKELIDNIRNLKILTNLE